MKDDQRNTQMQHLVAEIFELAGTLRRDGEKIAKLAGQTQARWQVMWIAATGQLSVATIARRLGLTRQSVQRVADAIVADGLATFQPNPDHQRSPLLILTADGQAVLERINDSSRQYNLENATILGEDGITELRRLIRCYRDGLHQ